MSNKKKEELLVDATVGTKRTSMGTGALLSSELKGHKLAGVLKMFGENEILNGGVKQTVSNKTSKAGLKLREKTNEQVDKDEVLVAAMKTVSNNFGMLKDAMTQKEVELSEEMKTVYNNLLMYGRKDKLDAIPDEINF